MAELLAGAFVAAYLGFALLALSLPRHWRELTGETEDSPPAPGSLRLAGHAALAVAFALAVLRDGPAFGSVLGVLLLTAGAFAVAFTLSWRPQWLAALAPVARALGRRNDGV